MANLHRVLLLLFTVTGGPQLANAQLNCVPTTVFGASAGNITGSSGTAAGVLTNLRSNTNCPSCGTVWDGWMSNTNGANQVGWVEVEIAPSRLAQVSGYAMYAMQIQIQWKVHNYDTGVDTWRDGNWGPPSQRLGSYYGQYGYTMIRPLTSSKAVVAIRVNVDNNNGLWAQVPGAGGARAPGLFTIGVTSYTATSGQYIPSDSNTCVSCPAGQFQASTSHTSSSCMVCPAGSTSYVGASFCTTPCNGDQGTTSLSSTSGSAPISLTSYTDNNDCYWTLSCSGGLSPNLTFTSINTESCCDYVYLCTCTMPALRRMLRCPL
eukprot:COSAG01_NODE_11235_length_1976_cov_6.068727_2_plen_320_part_00